MYSEYFVNENLQAERIKYANTNNTNYEWNFSNLHVMILTFISKLV
jgi:hypothetical protein